MSTARAVQQIIVAADELLRRIIAWLDDSQRHSIPPEGIGVQIQLVDAYCRESQVPDDCRPLQLAAARLAEEYRAFTNREFGHVRSEDGAPGPSFWAAVKEFAISRQSAEKPLVERLEPVGILLKQGVSHAQIGMHIYGRRGVGPFIQASGDVDVGLIEQEAASPGSVISKDWVPPWVTEAAQRRQEQLQERLQRFTDMETAKRYDDPCTVEEMLQQGAFVQQIERAKNVSREEVLAAARQIGVEPVDGPGYQPGYRDRDRDASGEGIEGGDGEESESADRDAAKELIIELYTAGELGAPEIAAELRKRGHTSVNTQAVSAIIGHHKRNQRASRSQKPEPEVQTQKKASEKKPKGSPKKPAATVPG